MVFSSATFIFMFLPITLMLYFVAYKMKKTGLLNLVLLLASIVFYGWGGTTYLLILIAIVAISYFLTILMSNATKYKTVLLILILTIDLGNLFYFKYFNFFVSNAQNIANHFNLGIFSDFVEIVLPIGISFYTFQILSYVIDVYKGRVTIQKNFLNLLLYVMMFPQLIAGPIVRYVDVNDEIENRKIDCTDVEDGIKRFIVGFFKKVFIANAMGGVADTVFTLTGNVNMLYAWLGAICYALQIYYDFSAYSDMAIGLGRILGFHFNENFNLPYTSKSIKEFWRRWHISLSSWFRDYVYIPLGGNRKGVKRTYLNLFLVFLLTGLWHGAAWQFVVWGLFHGMFIIIERVGFDNILNKLHPVVCHLYTMLVVIIGWVFFRADNLLAAIKYLGNMFSFNFDGIQSVEVVTKLTNLFWICLIIAIVFSITRFDILKKWRWWNNKTFVRIRYVCLWIISVLYLTGISYNPFIYFKF